MKVSGWLLIALAVWLSTGVVRGQGTQKTIWDGVYTAEQAAKGAEAYGSKCAACHGASLEGADVAPALAGDVFNGTWSGLPLNDLFERIRSTMPADAPGSVGRQQVADILAYLLKVGNFPAGSMPLSGDTVLLGQVRFEGLRPDGR